MLLGRKKKTENFCFVAPTARRGVLSVMSKVDHAGAFFLFSICSARLETESDTRRSDVLRTNASLTASRTTSAMKCHPYTPKADERDLATCRVRVHSTTEEYRYIGSNGLMVPLKTSSRPRALEHLERRSLVYRVLQEAGCQSGTDVGRGRRTSGMRKYRYRGRGPPWRLAMFSWKKLDRFNRGKRNRIA